MQVEIYGYSDDNLVVKGGSLTDEWGAYDRPKWLTFGDGTQLKCEYSPDGYDGKWKIERVKEGTASYSRKPSPDAGSDYSDYVTLDGDLKWVDCWSNPTPGFDELCEWAKGFDWTNLHTPQLEAIRNIALGR